MTQTLMFELEARDEAMGRVADNAGQSWQEQAAAVVRGMSEREVTGEDIRLACEAMDVRPHHHNAWGALTNLLIRDGLLVPTGMYRPMKAIGSHARKTQVYRITLT
jgi:hypothetical protein